jgi:hypothetical protein
MSTDDDDFFAACVMVEFGYRSALSVAARVVAVANDLTPATGQTEQ